MIERYFQKFGFDRYHQRGREGRRYAFAQNDKRQIGNGVAWLSAPDFLLNTVRNYEKDDDTVNEIAESLYEYNSNNAVTSITHNNAIGSQIVKHSYTYDETNNIVEYLNSIDGNTEYNYDFLGQLISADHANQTDESYTYDANGNRVVVNGNTYTTGTNNELTSDGDYTYTYDAEGNRTSKTNSAGTERELYTWDYRNRLTTVTKQTFNTETQTWTTVQVIEYTYDYNNIWIRKVVGNDKTIFIPEDYQTTVQIDNGTVSHHYLWTPNQQDKLLADTTPNGVSWSLTDHLGTIRDVLGATSTHLIYDAFGNLTSGTNPLIFGYTGKPFDPATNLQNNINRWYDATTGRWLSTDPIGFNGNDTNLYRYIRNSVNIYNDYSGTVPSDFVFADIATRDLKIRKILDDKARKPVGKKDPNCVTLSIILELTGKINDINNIGHAGIGIGNDFYDYGPAENFEEPNLNHLLGLEKPTSVLGTRWWDEANLNMDKSLINHINEIQRDYPDYAFVVFKISICKEKADKIKEYWEKLYNAIDTNEARYSIPGLHCTSAVLRPILGKSPIIDRTFPGMLFAMLADSNDSRFYHSCGENKGKPVKMYVIKAPLK